MRRSIGVTVIVAGSLLALLAMQPGLDYFNDSGSIDALARGDLDGFFLEQPLMGPLSLLVRAPFVAAVYHADLTTVYYAGAAPCLAALGVFTWRLLARMAAGRRSREDRWLVALLCLGSIALVRAMHWGHPEDVLAAALAVGAMLAADARRPVLTGVLLGAAIASKQWAILAVLPALLVLPGGRRACVLAVGATGMLLFLPMLIGDPERFLLVQRAAGSVDPLHVLGARPQAPGAHVNPFSVWLPFASESRFDGQTLLFMDDTLARFSHPVILLVGLGLPALAWRRDGRLSLLTGLNLLALILLLRCVLDPMSLEYYHLPLVLALAAAAGVGGKRELDVALLATAGLTIAFLHTAVGVDELEQAAAAKFVLYLTTALPLAAWLAREVFGPAPVTRLSAAATRSG